MELYTVEVTGIEAVVSEVQESTICELNELQLALIGGGCGEVVFA